MHGMVRKQNDEKRKKTIKCVKICEFVQLGETRRVSNSMLDPNLNRVQMSCVP